MTAKLNRMTASLQRMGRTARTVDENVRQMERARNFGVSSVQQATNRAEQFNRQQREAEQGARRLNGEWSRLRGNIQGALTAIGIKKILDISDTMAQTTARINIMNDGLQTTAQLQDQIMRSANRSRTAYTDVAGVVSKLGILAGESFSSNSEMIAFAELMNKNFVVGGASQQEKSAGMYQLTQAMAAGKLQGDEFRSIMENAPLLAQAIADFTGKSKGELKEMSAQGTITAEIIKGAMFASADQINARFASMPMTWGQVWTLMGNTALTVFNPLLMATNWLANNISIIGPMVLGLGAAFLVFQVAAHWTQIAAAASLAYNAVTGFLSIGFGILTGNAAAASAAVFKFNSALLASPVTWVIMLIAVLIGLLYAGVGAFNKFAGASVSATGIVCGAFAALGAFVFNVVILPLQNGLAALANFVGNVFQNPIVAVKILFLDMATTVLGYIANIARGIESLLNSIPGVQVNLTSGLDKIKGMAEGAASKAKSESGWKEYVKPWEAMDTKASFSKGYSFGQGLGNKASNAFGLNGGSMPNYGAGSANIPNIGKVGSVDKIGGEVNIAEEDLKFLRDVAEMRYVQNFVTLTPTVSMNAQISEKVDAKSLMAEIERALEEEFVAAAEGVYA